MTMQPDTSPGGSRPGIATKRACARRPDSAVAPRFSASWTVVLLAPILTGCQAVNDALIGNNDVTWLTLSLLATVVLGGGAMFAEFLRRLHRYDLAKRRSNPPWAFGSAGTFFWVAVFLAALIFSLYNWFSDIGIPPGQQWANIGAWCAGTLVGGAGALFGARELAHRRFRQIARRSHEDDS